MSAGQLHLYVNTNARASGNPAGVTADLRAAAEIRMSKISSLKRIRGKPHLSHCALTQRPVQRGSFTKPACVDKIMLILTCSWMWLSYYQEGSLKSRWEAPGFECRARSCGDHLQPVAIHPPSPPQHSPFPSPLIGRLIILSQRQWPNLHVRLCRGNVTEQRASAALQIGHV